MTYRISELDIEDVKRLKEKGLSQTIIAQRLNVSKVWICRKFKEIKNEKQSEGDSFEAACRARKKWDNEHLLVL